MQIKMNRKKSTGVSSMIKKLNYTKLIYIFIYLFYLFFFNIYFIFIFYLELVFQWKSQILHGNLKYVKHQNKQQQKIK